MALPKSMRSMLRRVCIMAITALRTAPGFRNVAFHSLTAAVTASGVGIFFTAKTGKSRSRMSMSAVLTTGCLHAIYSVLTNIDLLLRNDRVRIRIHISFGVRRFGQRVLPRTYRSAICRRFRSRYLDPADRRVLLRTYRSAICRRFRSRYLDPADRLL